MRCALIAAVLVALALSGCGGESGGERSRVPAATATATATVESAERIPREARRATERWARRANAICRSAQRSLMALGPELERTAAATEAKESGWSLRAGEAYGEVDRILTGVFEQLQDLPKPREDPRPGRVLAAYGQLIGHLGLAAGYYGDGAADRGTKFLEAAWEWGYATQLRGRSIGVTECFPGGPAPPRARG